MTGARSNAGGRNAEAWGAERRELKRRRSAGSRLESKKYETRGRRVPVYIIIVTDSHCETYHREHDAEESKHTLWV